MDAPTTLLDFSKGMNNIAPADALPDGYVRDMSNLDPMQGGALALRVGYSLAAAKAGVRGGVVHGDTLVVVSDTVEVFNPSNGSFTLLGAAPVGSTVIGAELNGDCFLQVGFTQLRIRDGVMAPWTTDPATASVTVASGALPAGIYRIATTTVDRFGAESGAIPAIINVPAGSSVTLNWPGEVRNVYASAANGETLYFQTTAAGTYTLLAPPVDSTAQLTTGNLRPAPLATMMAASKARLFLAAGRIMWGTMPFAPHLVDAISGYIAFDADIEFIQPVDTGVYVGTYNRTYFVTGFGGPDVASAVVAEVGGVRGSALITPDGTARWMSAFGQAIGKANGIVEFPHRGVYAPTIATTATVGIVNNNGIEMLVTNQRGAASNALGVVDSFDLEIEQ